MGKKGGKGKKKKIKEVDPNAVTNVDKAFHELLVAEIHKKMERLRNLTEEFLANNEELELKIKVAESEHGDLISSLKRTLNEKSNEVSEYQELLKESERLRAEEDYNHQEEIIQAFEAYRLAHEQLTSAIKALSGKLTALEEFRSQRDELFEKYELQQNEIADKEEKHKKALYEIEKKFIVAKDKLRIEMEARIVQLSTEFQEITEMRIATTTHRVVRENIAVGNQLDSMLITTKRLYLENGKLAGNIDQLKEDAKMHNASKKQIIGQCIVQQKVIEGLGKEVDNLNKYSARFDGIKMKLIKLQQALDAALLQSAKAGHRLRLLEQNFHASRAEWTRLKTDFDYCKEELDRCSSVVYEVLMTIKTALLIKIVPKEKLRQLAARRKFVMAEVVAMLVDARMAEIKRPSLESIQTVQKAYDRGDLGFKPKPILLRSDYPMKKGTETKLGSSFENLVSMYLEEQKQMRHHEPVTDVDDEDVEHEKSVTYVRSLVKFEGPYKTVFDDSTEVASSSTTDEVTYHVHLPPKDGTQVEEQGTEILVGSEYDEEEGESEEEGEGEEELTTELEMEGVSEASTEEEKLSDA